MMQKPVRKELLKEMQQTTQQIKKARLASVASKKRRQRALQR